MRDEHTKSQTDNVEAFDTVLNQLSGELSETMSVSFKQIT